MISTTLHYLFKQQLPIGLRLEIILVDNASSDRTVTAAEEIWLSYAHKLNQVSYTMVSEPRQGLSYARFTGAHNATHPYLIYCDDDNYLSDDYCAVAYDLMENDPTIGACGGEGIPVFESGVAPEWSTRLGLSFAWGAQNAHEGYLDSYSLYGAGLTMRRSIIMRLIDVGYQPVMQDRSGTALSSGGDEELTMWCKIMGYRLYYTPRLRFQHFIKGHRLTIDYVKRLYQGFGISLARQIPLQIILFNQEKTYHRLWTYQLVKWLVIAMKHCLDFRKETILRELDCRCNYYRVKTFFSQRKTYYKILESLIDTKTLALNHQ
ncbi:MAG: glycosyltransferase [Saprospiraceae bacterium]|nr:glycosyltransferase [Saprospiraceae bacterium]